MHDPGIEFSDLESWWDLEDSDADVSHPGLGRSKGGDTYRALLCECRLAPLWSWVPRQASCRPFLILFRESTSLTSFGDFGGSSMFEPETDGKPSKFVWGWPWTITAGSQMGTLQSTALHTTGVRADHGFSGELSAGGCNGPTSMQGIVPIVPGYSNGCIGPVATTTIMLKFHVQPFFKLRFYYLLLNLWWMRGCYLSNTWKFLKCCFSFQPK